MNVQLMKRWKWMFMDEFHPWWCWSDAGDDIKNDFDDNVGHDVGHDVVDVIYHNCK